MRGRDMHMHGLGRIAVGLALATVALGGGSKSALSPKVADALEWMSQSEGQDPGGTVHPFARGEFVSVSVVAAKDELKPHYHEHHEEVVYMVRGRGKLRLGDEVKTVEAGDLMFIPRNCVHAFVPDGNDCVALSVFGPPFDGRDRIFVDPTDEPGR